MGGVIGLAQWLVIKRYTEHTRRWVLAAMPGWALVYAIGTFSYYMLSFPDDDWESLLWFAPLCTLVGESVKWLLLRNWVRRAGWWVLGGAVGAAIGVWIGLSWFKSMADQITW
jgi:hypothetical protein